MTGNSWLDCNGYSLNDQSVVLDKQSYESVDSVVEMLKPGSFMAVVDIKSAYRSVAIHPSSYDAAGIQWIINGVPRYIVDTHMMFGARPAPTIFHRLSQACKRIMFRMGHTQIVAYQDDFLVMGDTYSQCLESWVALIQLLLRLGFEVNYSKLKPPSRDITYLGIRIQSQSMELSLPPDKLDSINECLHTFKDKSRACKRQLQSLAGKLNYAARVVRGGRTFLRRLLDAINSLRFPHHKCRIRGALLKDIEWWINYMSSFNGKSACIQSSVNCKSILTDACLVAGGAFWNGDFVYIDWSADYPKLADAPINYKEAMTAALAVNRWAPNFGNSMVYLYTDNKCTVSIINKCSCRNQTVMSALRDMFWLSAVHNFHVKAIYNPGANHVLPDTISRIHEYDKIALLESLINDWYRCHTGYYDVFSHVSFLNHMSLNSLCSVFCQVHKWRRVNNYWTI